jgi:hypothetical protein
MYTCPETKIYYMSSPYAAANQTQPSSNDLSSTLSPHSPVTSGVSDSKQIEPGAHFFL